MQPRTQPRGGPRRAAHQGACTRQRDGHRAHMGRRPSLVLLQGGDRETAIRRRPRRGAEPGWKLAIARRRQVDNTGDTAAGRVTDPGWCQLTLHDEATRISQGWRSILGDTLPTGQRRRGWDAPAGKRRLAIEGAPRPLGGDSAEVRYLLTIAPNASGLALGANGDTVRSIGETRPGHRTRSRPPGGGRC